MTTRNKWMTPGAEAQTFHVNRRRLHRKRAPRIIEASTLDLWRLLQTLLLASNGGGK